METIIRGMEVLVPSGGRMPKFEGVDIYDSYFRSSETIEFDATDTLFTNCVFDGLWPKNPRGCIGCTNRPDSLDLQLLKMKKGDKVSQRTAYEEFKKKIEPMVIDLQDKKEFAGVKWEEPQGAMPGLDYKQMWTKLKDELVRLQVKVNNQPLPLPITLNIMNLIEEVYNARRNK